MNTTDFTPNWASVPGESIADILHERNITVEQFANQLDGSIQDVMDLLHGFTSIDERIANKLEQVLGGSMAYWLRREQQYRQSVERLRSAEEVKWINELPIKDMLKYNWISKKSDITAACLQFFNVPDVWTWRKKYRDINTFASFRRSSIFKSLPAAVATWIRQAEIQAEKMRVKEWDHEKFKEALPQMKSLSRTKNPLTFLPKLQTMCAECGVALVMTPAPEKCAASGVAKFLNHKKALIVQSFRYGTDDHFWFTFFHEAGHLLLHGNNEIFIDEKNFSEILDTVEQEANEFSVACLIPHSVQSKLREMTVVSERTIKDAANESGVSVGIIVGQLQHLKKIPYSHFTGFKRKYDWGKIFG
jgi:HTH-type transcriptional regulator/antitoxin HigA